MTKNQIGFHRNQDSLKMSSKRNRREVLEGKGLLSITERLNIYDAHLVEGEGYNYDDDVTFSDVIDKLAKVHEYSIMS